MGYGSRQSGEDKTAMGLAVGEDPQPGAVSSAKGLER